MQRALQFKRRLAQAWAAVLLALLFAFYFSWRSSTESENLNRWVAHTQEALGLIHAARLDRVRVSAEIWAFRSTHDPALPGRFRGNLADLLSKMRELRDFTRDNPEQQKLLAALEPLLEDQAALLQSAMERAVAAAANPNGVMDMTPPVPPAEQLRTMFDQLESNERVLFQQRSLAAQHAARTARVVGSSAALLAIVILLIAGYVIQREVITRAKAEAGLRTAQNLLGVRYEEQRIELDHAVEDLHAQIRARKTAEQETLRLNSELEERVRSRTAELQELNRELEAFSYSVSHDLRAPLRHMHGFSKMLEQEYGEQLPEEAKHYLERIRSGATHMSALVEDLLQLARVGRQVPQRETVSLREIVEEVRRDLSEGGANSNVAWQIGPLPDIEGDPVLLRQVFANLLGNAVKFSRNREHPQIEIASRGQNEDLLVYVRDNGAGFDPRFADKLFGVFQRLHRQDEFEGTGIGLATVQRIIHKHGGRVWAESQPDKGATFFFTLPARTHEKPSLREPMGAAV